MGASAFVSEERLTGPVGGALVLLQLVLREIAMRITSKGQVTIPVEIRERLGLLPNSEVEFEVEGNAVRIRKRRRGARAGRRGKSLVQHLRGKATSGMSTDEIMALTRVER